MDKEDLEFGKEAKGFGGTPRECGRCGKLYIPDGWHKRATSLPDTFPHVAFMSVRCREKMVEVCRDCYFEIQEFIEKNIELKGE